MLHLVETQRVYDPETVAAMTAAVDRVCHSVSQSISGNDNIKQTLALIILQHADRGERDAERLAEVALREWKGRHSTCRNRMTKARRVRLCRN
jgi:hypothetical protein